MITQENEELLYNQLYEKTKDCGRTQFVKLLMEKEREIERLKSLLKCDYEDNQEIMADIIKEKQELIDYLKEEQNRLARETSAVYEDGLGKRKLVNEEIYNEVSKILSKIEKR